MSFQPFDPDRETSIYHRNLPHWDQPGVTYFITFRLADSLPTNVLQQIAQERQRWLHAHALSSVEELANQPDSLRWEYAKTFNTKWHAGMDAGHGECLLKRPELRFHVQQALQHWQGSRWDLDCAVVMPNHVHALVSPGPDWNLAELLHSVKRFSAGAINAAVGRKGSLWQDESFDHIVRSQTQLVLFRKYIYANPTKAGLNANEFWLNTGSD